jgi:nitrite reductase/ring-hydroxylating ferredoxin subunit
MTPEQTAADPSLTLASIYRREVGASIERILENVFDWEHLPALHDSYFTAVEKLEAGDWGWRVRLSRPPSTPERDQILSLTVEREHNRYTALTEAGIGQGTRFWVQLTPLAPHCTAIEVKYYLPEHRPERVEMLAEKYLASCERLWSEDEVMMRHREAALARARAWAGQPRPPQEPVALGPLESLALPLTVEFGGRPFRVIALEDGGLVAHSTICPHWLGPLDETAIEDGHVLRCPWHDYRFDARTGASCDGRGYQLMPAPEVVVEDGQVSLRRRA